MQLGELLRERQADSESAAVDGRGPRGLAEYREDVRQLGRPDSDAGVDDTNGDGALLAAHLDANAAARLGVPRRVREEVREDLSEADGIAMKEDRILRQDDLEGVLPAEKERPRRLERALHDGGEGDSLGPQADLPVRDPGNVEEIVDEPDEMGHLPLDDHSRLRESGPILLSVPRARQDLRRVRDGGEGIAELVREGGQELVLPAIHVAELLLGPAPLGHLRRERGVHRLEAGGALLDPLLQLLPRLPERDLAAARLDGVADRALEDHRVEAVLREEERGPALHRGEVQGPVVNVAQQEDRRAASRLVVRTQQVDAALFSQRGVEQVSVVPVRGHPPEPGLERPRPVDLDLDRHLRDEVADPGGVLLVRGDEEDAQGRRTPQGRPFERARGKALPRWHGESTKGWVRLREGLRGDRRKRRRRRPAAGSQHHPHLMRTAVIDEGYGPRVCGRLRRARRSRRPCSGVPGSPPRSCSGPCRSAIRW